MARSFGLSFMAIDILLERLELGSSPFPFEIPHFGQTYDERATIRGEVLAELRQRGLGDEATQAVTVFARPQVVITAFGKLDAGPLFARICASGQRAIKAVGAADTVHFEHIRPTSLVSTAVGLLPAERAGAGQSVTVAQAPQARARQDGVTRAVRGPLTAALFKAQSMVEREKLRLGQFGVKVRGRPGPDLFWYDTAAGRYVLTSTTGRDGQPWMTISPADNARIAQLLAAMLSG